MNQWSHLEVLGRPYSVLEIRLELAACKARVLALVLCLQISFFFFFHLILPTTNKLWIIYMHSHDGITKAIPLDSILPNILNLLSNAPQLVSNKFRRIQFHICFHWFLSVKKMVVNSRSVTQESWGGPMLWNLQGNRGWDNPWNTLC